MIADLLCAPGTHPRRWAVEIVWRQLAVGMLVWALDASKGLFTHASECMCGKRVRRMGVQAFRESSCLLNSGWCSSGPAKQREKRAQQVITCTEQQRVYASDSGTCALTVIKTVFVLFIQPDGCEERQTSS